MFGSFEQMLLVNVPLFDHSFEMRLKQMSARYKKRRQTTLSEPDTFDNCLRGEMQVITCLRRIRQAQELALYYWYQPPIPDEAPICMFEGVRSWNPYEVDRARTGILDVCIQPGVSWGNELANLTSFLTSSMKEKAVGQFHLLSDKYDTAQPTAPAVIEPPPAPPYLLIYSEPAKGQLLLVDRLHHANHADDEHPESGALLEPPLLSLVPASDPAPVSDPVLEPVVEPTPTPVLAQAEPVPDILPVQIDPACTPDPLPDLSATPAFTPYPALAMSPTIAGIQILASVDLPVDGDGAVSFQKPPAKRRSSRKGKSAATPVQPVETIVAVAELECAPLEVPKTRSKARAKKKTNCKTKPAAVLVPSCPENTDTACALITVGERSFSAPNSDSRLAAVGTGKDGSASRKRRIRGSSTNSTARKVRK